VVSQAALTGPSTLLDLQTFVTYQPPLLLASGDFYVDVLLQNWTNTPASGVKLDLTLDNNIHFMGVDTPGASCLDDPVFVSCDMPDIAAGSQQAVRISFKTDRIYQYAVDRTLSFTVSSDKDDYLPANNRVVLFEELQRSWDYFNDFSAGADGYWSDQTTTTPVAGLDVLGLFDNDRLTFNAESLPFHDRVWLCYDLYILGGWDGSQYLADDDQTIIGPDLWANYIDDNRLLVTTFSNQALFKQAFPSNYPDALNDLYTGSRTTGEFDGLQNFQDARYYRCTLLEHSQLSMKALFMGLNLNEKEPERWAIDNVKISVFYNAAFDYVYMPVVQK